MYTRIRGALRDLGHDLGRSTIRRILADAGIEPAPERSKRTSWAAFLKVHSGAIAAMDFFNVEVLTMHGLVRYWVLSEFLAHFISKGTTQGWATSCSRRRRPTTMPVGRSSAGNGWVASSGATYRGAASFMVDPIPVQDGIGGPGDS